MRRRALLATLATTPLAGCSAIFGDRPNDGPATTRTHVVPRTPLPTPVPTPERPADLADDEAVAAHLRENERATVHNRAVNGDRTVRLDAYTAGDVRDRPLATRGVHGVARPGRRRDAVPGRDRRAGGPVETPRSYPRRRSREPKPAKNHK